MTATSATNPRPSATKTHPTRARPRDPLYKSRSRSHPKEQAQTPKKRDQPRSHRPPDLDDPQDPPLPRPPRPNSAQGPEMTWLVCFIPGVRRCAETPRASFRGCRNAARVQTGDSHTVLTAGIAAGQRLARGFAIRGSRRGEVEQLAAHAQQMEVFTAKRDREALHLGFRWCADQRIQAQSRDGHAVRKVEAAVGCAGLVIEIGCHAVQHGGQDRG